MTNRINLKTVSYSILIYLSSFQLLSQVLSQININELFAERQNSRSTFVYKSYQKSIYCNPAGPILSPKNEVELQSIVHDAIIKNSTVKAIGSRHSITDIICTDGIPISMRFFNKSIANDDGTATFGAGIELQDAMEFLESINRSLIHIPSFGGITLGGAISTGAHGSSLLHPNSISDQVVKMTIVDGTGMIKTIGEENDLNAFKVHLGLLGLIINVTIQTVPLFKMTVENKVEPESILLDGQALKWANEYDMFQMWWFPSSKSVVVSKGKYTYDLSTPGNARTNLIPDEDPSAIAAGRLGFETLQATRNVLGQYALEAFTQLSLHQQVLGKPPIFTEDGITLKNPATGFGWRLQANKCTNKCAWDNGDLSVLPEESAMAFEISTLPAVIKTISSILSDLEAAFPMIGIFIRFSRASNGILAISSGHQTVHLDWATPMRNDPYRTSKSGIGAFQAILQAMITKHNGRPHWGKNGLYFLSQPIMIGNTIPNRLRFIEAMNKFDPNGVFLNKFGKRLLGESDDIDIDPQVTHTALQDYSLCSQSSDCANGQLCYKYMDKYPICRDSVLIIPKPLPPINLKNRTAILESIANLLRN